MGIGSESAGALKGSVLYQSPAVLVDAYTNRLGHADVKARWISVESRELTRMGIVGGIHPVALQFRKSRPQPWWLSALRRVGSS